MCQLIVFEIEESERILLVVHEEHLTMKLVLHRLVRACFCSAYCTLEQRCRFALLVFLLLMVLLLLPSVLTFSWTLRSVCIEPSEYPFEWLSLIRHTRRGCQGLMTERVWVRPHCGRRPR